MSVSDSLHTAALTEPVAASGEPSLGAQSAAELLEQIPVGVAILDCDGRVQQCNPALCELTGYASSELLGHALPELLRAHQIEDTAGLSRVRIDANGASIRTMPFQRRDGSVLWIRETVALVRDPLGEPLRMIALVWDISQHKAQERALVEERAFMKAVVANVPAGLLVCNAQGEIVLYNQRAADLFAIAGNGSVAEASRDYPLQSAIFEADGVTPMPRERRPLARTLRGEALSDVEQVVQRPQGERRTLSVSAHRVVADDGDFLGAVSISQDITERKQTAAKLEQLQRRLVDASRSAGMAEIATNVLHNVGNALNGVNVSAGLLASRLRRSRVEGLERLLALFEREQADLAGFLAAPGKASQVLGFLREVTGGLAAERDDMLAETASMQKNIDHIKAIVDMQQSYARHRGVVEELDIATVIDDSLQINAGACQRHGVIVQRELEATPRIVTQRHKVMQILVNLIRNAKYACDAAGVEAKRVVVRATGTPAGIAITVHDNGVGIRAEHRELLFTHGFTTKPDGHGFGLHSAALAARELGGSLSAHSDGPGLGAAFTLELPLRPPESAHE